MLPARNSYEKQQKYRPQFGLEACFACVPGAAGTTAQNALNDEQISAFVQQRPAMCLRAPCNFPVLNHMISAIYSVSGAGGTGYLPLFIRRSVFCLMQYRHLPVPAPFFKNHLLSCYKYVIQQPVNDSLPDF